MTAEEWANLAGSMASVWPSGKLDAEQVATWYGLLSDLEAGHVVSALMELGRTSKFQPSVAELRMETARQEVNGRPIALPSPEDPSNPFITLIEWRRQGYPGVEEYGVTPERAAKITGELVENARRMGAAA